MKKLLLVGLAVGFYALAQAQTTTTPSGTASPSGTAVTPSDTPSTMGTGTTTDPSGTVNQQREENLDNATTGGDSRQQRMEGTTGGTNGGAIDDSTIESDSMDMDSDAAMDTMDTTNP